MAGYQLPISITLSTLAGTSAFLLLLNGSSEGKIQLPADLVEDTYGDPLDVTSAEDLLDGYPIDESKFWAQVGTIRRSIEPKLTVFEQMRSRKLFVCVLLTLLSINEGACLLLSGEMTISTLHVCFALYLLTVALLAVRRETAEKHAESIWHLTSLTFFAVGLLSFNAMLPKDSPVIIAVGKTTAVLWYLQFTALSLYVATFLTVLTTARGPRLHYPPSSIYSEKTAQAITNTDENNVAGISGNSLP